MVESTGVSETPSPETEGIAATEENPGTAPQQPAAEQTPTAGSHDQPGADEASSAEPSAIRSDQAEGLRAMFGSHEPRVICLACALDADTAAAMAMGMAHALRRQEQKVLLIDEIALQERRQLGGLPYRVRYDIAQAMENDIPLKRAIQCVEPNFWFATGLRMARSYQNRKLRNPPLMDRLTAAEMHFDLVLIASTHPVEGVLRHYAREMQQLVVTAPEEANMIRALETIRTLSQHSDCEKIPVLIVGGDTAEASREAFEQLEQASQTILEQPLEYVGWIPAVTIPFETDKSADPAGLILPATLYAKLAGYATQL
jgi:hypothetical protein